MLNFIIHKTHLYLTEWPSFNNLWEIPVKVPRLETLNHQVPQWTRFPYGDVVWGCPTCGWKNDPLTLKILTLDAIRICSKMDFYSLQIISIVSVSMMAKTKVIRETFVRIIQFVLTRLLLSFRIYYLKFNPIIPGKNCRLNAKIWKNMAQFWRIPGNIGCLCLNEISDVSRTPTHFTPPTHFTTLSFEKYILAFKTMRRR